ncbi:PQB biosynthetic 3-oxoacyl-[acyl-carrier-protein] synthase III [Vibrio aerogenes CECT 7868]|uniref:PQB biosynthetic 3-oxoacyl-[acyl-carrier-protein] synthase III n=1 Tax=Vibrio aerogenes CECT 7868 TaxID=1216006 RepID=A0A1M5ZBZ5_9VIBR|nr:hydroxymethylglutaryl-CoA synthase [Vibrio aerogenes]SHI21718.1 PQB biosynthetic 3-oxoacyl-[acyl-carrier-protein] synthase III [Vibrio aerogenes CECT 7868]
MKPMSGITGYGYSLPFLRLSVEQTTEVWKNTPLALLKNGLKVSSRTVLQPDEDTITLAADAARQALKQHLKQQARFPDISPEAIYLGTCTNPYQSRSSAAIVAEMLGLSRQLFCADIQFAGKSGTSALQICHALINSGMCHQALAIGSDTMNRHTAPGDLTESYAGAGAVAMLLGTERVIARIDNTGSGCEDLADNIRPEGERYIRSGMSLGSDKNNLGIYRHMQLSGEQLLHDMDCTWADFDFVVVQQPTESAVDTMTEKLQLEYAQTVHSRYAATTGDIGSASPLMGLAATLDHAQPGQKILMLSYGFGAGSDAIALTVTDEILPYREQAPTVAALLARTKEVSYAEAAKYEFKFSRPDYALAPYL